MGGGGGSKTEGDQKKETGSEEIVTGHMCVCFLFLFLFCFLGGGGE